MTTSRRDMLLNLGMSALFAPAIMRSRTASAKCVTDNTLPLPKPQKPHHPHKAPPRVHTHSSISHTTPHRKKVADNLHKHRKHHRPVRSAHDNAHNLRAQRTLDTPGNRRTLALTIWAEARGYGELGMISVGNVIMNRVRAGSDFFGHGVEGVCHQRKQFSCWNRNDPNRERMKELPNLPSTHADWQAFEVADRVAGRLLAGIEKDNTSGATYYCASYMTPYWSDDMTIVGVMFGHTFYKPKVKKHTHNSHHKGHKGSYHHSHNSHHHKAH